MREKGASGHIAIENYYILMSMPKIEQEDSSYYSNNQLNLGFIAENSKDIESISLSGSVSEKQSISSISRVASKSGSIPGSPFCSFEPEISNMEEWPTDNLNVFGKKEPHFTHFRKKTTRNSTPQPIQEINEEERELEKISKAHKKRIGDKNKVTVLHATSLHHQYGLRSKAKVSTDSTQEGIPNAQSDSSSEEMRQMLASIGNSKKPMEKGIRKMLPQ